MRADLARSLRSAPFLLVLACADASPDAPQAAAYLVEPGDTLSGIAHRFGVPGGAQALAELNELADPHRIEAGRGLIVPLPEEGLVEGLVPWEPPVLAGPRPADCASAESWTFSDRLDPEGVLIPNCLEEVGLCLSPSEAGVTYALETPWLTAPRQQPSLDPAVLYRVDLDGDGEPALVLVHHVATSMGIAVSTYRVFVADRLGGPAASFVASGAWLVEADGGACDLVVEDLVGVPDLIRGHGNYYVQRRLTWAGGHLVPRGERVRAQRLAEIPPELRPDPALAGRLIEAREGRVVALDQDDLAGPTVHVDHGEGPVAYEPERQWIGWLGDPLLLPRAAHPARDTDWVGRRVVVETRSDRRRVLWLER